MKKGDIVTGRVIGVDFPNKGKVEVRENDELNYITVKNTIPDQLVSVRIQKKKHGKMEGCVVDILEPAACETESDCPHFGQCGGCLYRTLPYEEQLKLKESMVYHLLEKVYINQKMIWTSKRYSNRLKEVRL